MPLGEPSQCNFCREVLGPRFYSPIGSTRSSRVYECKYCGLVQTISDKSDRFRGPSLSSDANWGNIRHAKGLRLDSQKRNLIKILERLKPDAKVLDVGSSRGQFLSWLSSNHLSFKLMGIEPDESLVHANPNYIGIPIQTSYLEDVEFESQQTFDFIFCNHTLEHVNDALKTLKKLKVLLNTGGWLWIDVPNIKGIDDPFVFEEFFIDKHTFHFSEDVLIKILESTGFEIEARYGDSMNIVLLVRGSLELSRLSPNGSMGPVMTEELNLSRVEKYSKQLLINRLRVPDIVAAIENLPNVAIYGAGRILNALIKFGGLETTQFTIADKYLWEKFGDLGPKILNPEIVDWSQFETVLILARSSTREIDEWLHQKGAKKTITLEELGH